MAINAAQNTPILPDFARRPPKKFARNIFNVRLMHCFAQNSPSSPYTDAGTIRQEEDITHRRRPTTTPKSRTYYSMYRLLLYRSRLNT